MTAAAISTVTLFVVVLFLIREAFPALTSPGLHRFLTDESWHPLSNRFRMTPMAAATAATTLGALVLAVPVGVASAVFVRFYAPAAAGRAFRGLLELMAGIPSVVFGLWGLLVLVPLLAGHGHSGQHLLAAICVLALMILPVVALSAAAALNAVPESLLVAAAALGLSRPSVALRIALPAARRGIAAGILLALSRALGETMAVVMVAGNVVQFPDSLTRPVRTLTGNLALELGYAGPAHRSVLFASALMLMLAAAVSVSLARVVEGRPDE